MKVLAVKHYMKFVVMEIDEPADENGYEAAKEQTKQLAAEAGDNEPEWIATDFYTQAESGDGHGYTVEDVPFKDSEWFDI